MSVLTSFTGISNMNATCKGNSKKEKEVNMMINLVEEFLKKFTTSQDVQNRSTCKPNSQQFEKSNFPPQEPFNNNNKTPELSS